jgi:hypothetical protein
LEHSQILLEEVTREKNSLKIENKGFKVTKQLYKQSQIRHNIPVKDRKARGRPRKPFKELSASGRYMAAKNLVSNLAKSYDEEDTREILKKASQQAMSLSTMETIQLFQLTSLSVRKQRIIRSFLQSAGKNIFSSENKCRDLIKSLAASYQVETSHVFFKEMTPQGEKDVALDVLQVRDVKEVIPFYIAISRLSNLD